MKKIKEDAVPSNATGPGVVGTDGDTTFSPNLFGILVRKAIENKKKSRDGRKK
jgi:hypothetical protein